MAQLENKVFDLTASISDQHNLMREQGEILKKLADDFAEWSKKEVIDMEQIRKSPSSQEQEADIDLDTIRPTKEE